MIAIVDYGMGNLGSMVKMFKRIGVTANVYSDPLSIQFDKLVLPGVGSFDKAMTWLITFQDCVMYWITKYCAITSLF